jgi:ferredoxin
MKKANVLKTIVRLLILAGVLFMLLGGPIPRLARKVLPILSPLSAFSEAVAQRTWFTALYWLLPPLTVALLAVFKGRFFCQWLCPLGTIYSLPQKISAKKQLLPVRLNALIFWTVITSSLIGWPILLLLDPLCTISRIGVWYNALAWIPGALIPIMFLLSFIQPQVWCTHLCPLGYTFDLLNKRSGTKTFRRDRRQFLAGCGIGLSAAALLPKTVSAKEAKPSILPPGATDKFAETCTRCYACVAVCPSQVIQVKKGGTLKELAMPELCFNEGDCQEFCSRCTEVCPTGAIRQLTIEQKRQVKIGEARIRKGKCLAWQDNEYCMVCDEFCPYSAIATHTKGNGIACPVMRPERCRGCGACEYNCPAIERGKAITISARTPQEIIP